MIRDKVTGAYTLYDKKFLKEYKYIVVTILFF